MKPLISASNPIHRLREINDELARLILKLAPAYAAIDLLKTEENGIDVTIIEHHPVFRPIWEKTRELDAEALKLQMELSISWEFGR